MPDAETAPAEEAPAAALTPELVRKVADRVYAMLQEDLRRERERLRTSHIHWKTRKYR